MRQKREREVALGQLADKTLYTSYYSGRNTARPFRETYFSRVRVIKVLMAYMIRFRLT